MRAARKLQTYLTNQGGKPQEQKVSSSYIQFTILKAPLILSQRSKAQSLQQSTAAIALVIVHIACLVEHLGQFPIQPLGRSLCFSAVSAIQQLIINSITFPRVLRSAIGLQLPSQQYQLGFLLGLQIITISAAQKQQGKCLSQRLAEAS